VVGAVGVLERGQTERDFFLCCMVTYRTSSLIAFLLQTWTKIPGSAKHQDSIIESLQSFLVNLMSPTAN
jgi:hypothetical protein